MTLLAKACDHTELSLFFSFIEIDPDHLRSRMSGEKRSAELRSARR